MHCMKVYFTARVSNEVSMVCKSKCGNMSHGRQVKVQKIPSKRTACPALWSTPVIRHDGALMLCCADLEGQMTLGSLSDSRFSTLWLSESARKRRRRRAFGIIWV